ncbi:hypothetical protein HELRODRAFT_68345 [Helobdella robusta]|uniref:Uncharacterized protein n=1 Tax=Helobdella robusta TaxID=6412 RepID=T1FZD5_HELRO|nr:hypothetical protein HELRODRAFT_68345 [Helobdella robusta]ESN96209.1 hypothetical protein HELRODRAFT_68345 [Helobdella robusta]
MLCRKNNQTDECTKNTLKQNAHNIHGHVYVVHLYVVHLYVVHVYVVHTCVCVHACTSVRDRNKQKRHLIYAGRTCKLFIIKLRSR